MKELVRSKILSFRDVGPNVKNNPFPIHGVVNPNEDIFDVCVIKMLKISKLYS